MKKDNELTVIKNNQYSLSVIDSNVLELLSEDERKYLHAAFSPKINNISAKDAVEGIINTLTTIYTISGQKADASTLAIYADEFYQQVKRIYPYITLEEITIALRNGVYDQYGDYFGLNPKSYIYFLTCYIKSEQRAKAAENFYKAKALLSEPKLSEDEKEKENIEYVNQLYGKYLGGELDINFLPAFIYDFLLRKNLVSDNLNLVAAKIYYTRHLDHQRPFYLASTYIEAQKNERDAATKIVAKQMAVFDYFAVCKAHKRQTIL